MEYRHSTVIDKSAYDTEGLCEGIDLRRNVAGDLEEVGACRAQADWNRWIGAIDRPYKGTLGPDFCYFTVCAPECLPERLEVVGYVLEFGFLHDDLIDNGKNDAAEDEIGQALEQGGRTGNIEERGSSGKSKIAGQIFREMMAIDPERAIIVAKNWASGVRDYTSRSDTNFKTLEEYLPHRCMDAGYMIWTGVVMFGCAITIPEEEADTVKELLMPAAISTCLVNDLFSYEKERNDVDAQNAVMVVMEERCCSEEEAREICKKRIRVENATYVRTLKDIKNRTDLSDDVKRYLELMQYTVSGNLAWSTQCPRYHPGASFSELQLLRAEAGLEKYPAVWLPKEASNGVFLEAERKQSFAHGSFRSTPVADTNLRTDGLDSHHGVNGNGIDGHAIKSNGYAKTNGHNPSDVSRMNGANGVWKPTHNKRPSTDSLSLVDVVSLALDENLTDLKDDVILQPYRYLASLPSKGFRDQAIDSLNTWLKVPPKATDQIKNIVRMLHGASLMLDDLEDSSPLRRGKPSTHDIFGGAQTINSATYQYSLATELAAELDNPLCLRIFIEETKSLYIGQSYDLYWTHNAVCPLMSEYLKMVDDKTGGLFRMLTRLMLAESPMRDRIVNSDLNTLSCLIGRFFQIRDDYQNLVSADYAKQKGFAEDLDEGKYSFTLIHCIQALDSAPQLVGDAMQLRAILIKRRFDGKLNNECKREVLGIMKKTKSLEYTLRVLRTLHRELEVQVEVLETKFGQDNFMFKMMLELLRV